MIRSKNEYFKIRDKLFIIFLSNLIIFATCIALGQMQSIINYSFTLHELCFVPINISIFSIPINYTYWTHYAYILFNYIFPENSESNYHNGFKI